MKQPLRRIIIDTDPGCDDAIAILLAFASPELEILGLSVVIGNSVLPQLTTNALKLCTLAGRTEVPVYAGCSQPMLARLDTAEVVHGSDGMAELNLPEPAVKARDEHAVDWIVDTVMAHPPATVTICAMGPLTNIALAIVKQRAVATRVAEILIMGGSVFAGGNSNFDIMAESNFANDPHAARIVFESGARIVLAPLDLTHSTLATPARIAAMRAAGTPITGIVADIMAFYSRYDVEKMGLPGGPIHDPCLIAYLVAPRLFQGKDVFVEIETQSQRTMGMTVADWWHATGKPPNATVLHTIDSDGFFSLLTDRLSQL